jgi:uncharacterized protein YceK
MRWFYIAVAATALSGCASYTEKTSPCACDWTPVSAAGLVAV